MKKINITISGALGRMGQALIKIISKNKNLSIHSLTDLKIGKKIKGIRVQKNSINAFTITRATAVPLFNNQFHKYSYSSANLLNIYLPTYF